MRNTLPPVRRARPSCPDRSHLRGHRHPGLGTGRENRRWPREPSIADRLPTSKRPDIARKSSTESRGGCDRPRNPRTLPILPHRKHRVTSRDLNGIQPETCPPWIPSEKLPDFPARERPRAVNAKEHRGHGNPTELPSVTGCRQISRFSDRPSGRELSLPPLPLPADSEARVVVLTGCALAWPST